jgi:hypothetical protein
MVALVAGGLVLLVFGIAYLRRPTIFRRGIWSKTSIAIRLLSRGGYVTYMRFLGVSLIVAGVALVLFGALWSS